MHTKRKNFFVLVYISPRFKKKSKKFQRTVFFNRNFEMEMTREEQRRSLMEDLQKFSQKLQENRKKEREYFKQENLTDKEKEEGVNFCLDVCVKSYISYLRH